MAFDYRTWGDSWDEAWGDSFGIGLAEVGIGLAPATAPVDFVFSGGSWSGLSLNRNVVNLRDYLETKRAAMIREKKELREMIELYALWRRAA